MSPSWGTTTVTPVRAGPSPTASLPSPRMIVVCPTRTPATSVIALFGPGRPRPMTIPRSLARTSTSLVWLRSAHGVRRAVRLAPAHSSDRRSLSSPGDPRPERAFRRVAGHHPARGPFDDRGLPPLRLALHDWVIAWDRRTERAWLAGRAVDGDTKRLERRLAEVRARLTEDRGRAAADRDPGELAFISSLDRTAFETGVE